MGICTIPVRPMQDRELRWHNAVGGALVNAPHNENEGELALVNEEFWIVLPRTFNVCYKGKICNTCKAVGHLEANCPHAKNDSASANQKKTDEEPQWHCPTCFTFLNANVKICTGCRGKKTDAAPAAAKPDKPLAKAVDDWANWQTEKGLTEFYPEDEESEATKKELEENISRMTKQYGNADSIVTRLEEDLKSLQKKKPTRSLVKDGVAVAQSVKDATDKVAGMRSQAEMKLEKKIADRNNLEKKHIEGTKLMKEEYERKLKVVKETYESAKVKADEEVEQEQEKLEETKKEAIATVAQAHKAYDNLAAASTGSPQKIGVDKHLLQRGVQQMSSSCLLSRVTSCTATIFPKRSSRSTCSLSHR